MSARELITDHLDLWTGAITHKSGVGRGSNGKIELTGIKKLRELILELAVRGKLVDQDPDDEPASVLLERIAEEKARLVKEGTIKKPRKLPEITEDEKPLELPLGWRWERTGNLFNVVYGKGLSTSNLTSEGYDVYGANGIIGKYSEYTYSTPQLLISCRGAYSGKANLSLGECYITSNTLVLENTWKNLATKYFYYFYLIADKNKIVTGSAQPQVTVANLNPFLVAVPPLNEQLRIADKVDELMALCDRLEQQVGDQLEAHEVLVDTLLDTLTRSADAAELAENWARVVEHFDTLFSTEASIDKLKQTVLQLAVMGRLVPQDPDDEPVTSLLQRYGIKSKSNSLHGWAEVALGSLGEILGGSTPTKSKAEFWEGSIPWVSPKDMKLPLIQDSQVRITEEALKKTSLKVVPENSLIMVVRGMILAHSFPVAITGREVTINQDMKALVPPKEISTYLLLYLQAGKSKMVELVDRSSHGTCKLVSGKLWSHVIPLPPIEEQSRIVKKLDELMVLCDRLEARLGEAGETRTHLAETVVEKAVK